MAADIIPLPYHYTRRVTRPGLQLTTHGMADRHSNQLSGSSLFYVFSKKRTHSM